MKNKTFVKLNYSSLNKLNAIWASTPIAAVLICTLLVTATKSQAQNQQTPLPNNQNQAINSQRRTIPKPNFSPILSLKYGKPILIPGIEEAMRDSKITKKKIRTKTAVAGIRAKNKLLKLSLKKVKGPKKGDVAVKLMDNYAAEAYYYGDKLSGKIKGGSSKKNRKKMKSALKHVIEYANVVQSLSKSKKDRARASYHMYVAQYVRGDSRSRSIEKLRQLSKDEKNLTKSLIKRAKFLTSLSDLTLGKSNAAGSIETLKDSIGTSGGIAAKLALARFYAGIDGRGNKTGQPNQKYRSLLFAASDKSFKVGKKTKKKIFSFILGVWRTAEAAGSTWKKPPFNEDRFNKSSELIAISERDGLWEWNSGNKRKAISRQSSLSKSLKKKSIATKFDQRNLSMEEYLFATSNQYRNYEKLLISTRKRYSSSKSLGRSIKSPEKAMLVNLLTRHKKLVDSNLATAASRNFSLGGRRNAIKLAERFLSLAQKKNSASSESVEVRIAGLWVLNKEYPKAVDIFLRIAKTTVPKNKIGYLNQAIRSQLVVANWPSKVNWNGVSFTNSNKSARKKLIGIYIDLNSSKKSKVDWGIIGHIGQLHLSLNQQNSAFKIWEDSVRKSPKSPAAGFASGIMLSTYLKSKKWQDLENLSRFNLLAKVKPSYRKEVLIPATLLPFALVKGGDQAHKKKDYKTAVKKYKEFCYKFQAKDRDYGFMMLASSYKGNVQHKLSIETLIEFVEKFPKTRYFKKVLLNGGNWSVPLAYEENAMYFYKEFLKYFPGAKESQAVSDGLTKLYTGRRLYAEAGDILRKRAASPTLTASVKVNAQLQIMRIESKHGAKERALEAANAILRTNANQKIKSEALVIKSKQLYAMRDVNNLYATVKQLEGFGSDPQIQENLGEARYLLAEAKLGPIFQSVNSHMVKNPLQAVFDRYNLFMKSYADYSKVCSGGKTSYCAPSLHRIARLGERMVSLIEEFQIPATLEEKVIAEFMKKKNGLLSNVSKIIIASDKKAKSIVERGYTDPAWTQEVLWQNSSDWNFDRVTGGAGSGFVQWGLVR